MPSIDFTLPKAFFGIEEGAAGSHFGILPSLGSSERFEMSTKRPELLDVFDKRFAVVGEGQGDQPVTSHRRLEEPGRSPRASHRARTERHDTATARPSTNSGTTSRSCSDESRIGVGLPCGMIAVPTPFSRRFVSLQPSSSISKNES